MSSAVIETEGLTKTFRLPAGEVRALVDVDVRVEPGDYVAVRGKSGSGKSTLLNLLGCLDRPSSGRYLLDGEDVSALGDRELSRLRGERIGFVFQTFQLLPEQTVLENVCMPFLYRSVGASEVERRVRAALERVGLAQRITHRPAELSGGEMQRVAIARALSGDPAILLADEPTGNLDDRTGAEILGLFDELHQDGATLILVTHDDDVAMRAARRWTMRDGRLQEVD